MPYLCKKYRNGQPRHDPSGNNRPSLRPKFVRKYAEFSETFEYPVTPKRVAGGPSAANIVPEHVILDRLLTADRMRAANRRLSSAA